MRTQGRKNRAERYAVNTPGWIRTGAGFGVMRCAVINYSASGAQLELARARELPKLFTLSFSPSDRNGRTCELVWCEKDRAGVRFADPPAPVRPIVMKHWGGRT